MKYPEVNNGTVGLDFGSKSRFEHEITKGLRRLLPNARFHRASDGQHYSVGDTIRGSYREQVVNDWGQGEVIKRWYTHQHPSLLDKLAGINDLDVCSGISAEEHGSRMLVGSTGNLLLIDSW